MASIGSMAVKNAEEFFKWIHQFGGEKILLGADVKNGKLAINGWQTKTDLEILPFLKKDDATGVSQVFFTEMSAKTDFCKAGQNELYAEILREIPATKIDRVRRRCRASKTLYELEKIGCAGVIVGKAIYEGRIKLKSLKVQK